MSNVLLCSLLCLTMLQLGGVASPGAIFPNEPTKAFGNGWIGLIAYSPDGELLAAAGSEGVFLYDPETLTQVGHLPAEGGAITTIAFSPDGKWLASGDNDSVVQLWDTATWRQAITFKGHHYRITSVVFNPDGNLLTSASTDGTVRIWDAGISSLAFSPDGRLLASGDWNDNLILWDVEKETQIASYTDLDGYGMKF